jgi:hypothetical protein
MTTYSSGNIDGTQIVVQAMLNITQDISQGSIIQQNIKVDCANKNLCNSCLNVANKYKLAPNGDYSNICRACFCNLENINVNNIIMMNLSALQQSSSDDFVKQIKNSLTQQLASTGSMSNTTISKSSSESLSSTSSNIYNSISEQSFQEAVSGLKSFQIINVKNPNTSLINIELDIAVNYLSKIIQQNKEVSKNVNDLTQQISQITSESSQSILYVIVSFIITLVIIAIAIFVFIFMFNIISEDLIMFASS